MARFVRVRHGLVLLCAIAVSLLGGTAGDAQSAYSEYNCLHLFSDENGPDYQYDVGRKTVLPQHRLPGPAYKSDYPISADGKWYAFATRSEYGLLYVGPTIDGRVRFTRDNPIGFIQNHIVPWNLEWSPQKARLAYVYISGGERGSDGKDKFQYTLATFDVETRHKAEVAFPYDGWGFDLQWSLDEQYLAVMFSRRDAKSNGVAIYSSDSLKLRSFIAASSSAAYPISMRWRPRGNLAIYWQEPEERKQLISVIPGQEPQRFAIEDSPPESILWSPDGAYLAVLSKSRTHDAYQVTVLKMDIPGSEIATASVRIGDPDDPDNFVYGIRWTADSQSLILMKSKAEEEEWLGWQLLAYNLQTQALTTIVENAQPGEEPDFLAASFFPRPYPDEPFEGDLSESASTVLVTAKDKTGGQYSLYLIDLNTLERHYLLSAAALEDLTIRWTSYYKTFVVFQIETADVNAPTQRLYWGTGDGKIFRQVDNADIRMNILFRSDEYRTQIQGLDNAPTIAFVAKAAAQKEDDKTQTVLVVNLATGTTRVISGSFQDIQLMGGYWLEFSWVHTPTDMEEPWTYDEKAFVDAYDPDGTRVYRYPVEAPDDVYLPIFPVPIEVYRSPDGSAVTFLVGYSASIGGAPLYLLRGRYLKPIKGYPDSEYLSGYTGVVWSPDGRRFAAYDAATSMLDPFPRIDRLHIFTAAGDLVAVVPLDDELLLGGIWPVGFLWERCGDVFPDPYEPGDVHLNSWFAPPS